jgi:hypothetical protein
LAAVEPAPFLFRAFNLPNNGVGLGFHPAYNEQTNKILEIQEKFGRKDELKITRHYSFR